jgi:quercetin dioxygenase-like cupin family protein
LPLFFGVSLREKSADAEASDEAHARRESEWRCMIRFLRLTTREKALGGPLDAPAMRRGAANRRRCHGAAFSLYDAERDRCPSTMNIGKSPIRPLSAEEQASWPKGVIVPLEAPFADSRGSIQPLVDVSMESCVLITSKKGTVRANHYHQTDWHYCYVLSGAIEYYHRPQGSKAEPARVHITAGQMFFTPPMVEHAMFFPEDTVFLTFGRNSRAQEVYEADVVRVESLLRSPALPE